MNLREQTLILWFVLTFFSQRNLEFRVLRTTRHFEISLLLNSKNTSRSKLKNREGSLHYPWILLSMTHEDVFTYSYLAADKTKTAPDKTWVITELSWKLAPMIGGPVTVFMVSHIWSTYPFKEWISSVVHRTPYSRKEETTYTVEFRK